jgi:hypothetical protein
MEGLADSGLKWVWDVEPKFFAVGFYNFLFPFFSIVDDFA